MLSRRGELCNSKKWSEYTFAFWSCTRVAGQTHCRADRALRCIAAIALHTRHVVLDKFLLRTVELFQYAEHRCAFGTVHCYIISTEQLSHYPPTACPVPKCMAHHGPQAAAACATLQKCTTLPHSSRAAWHAESHLPIIRQQPAVSARTLLQQTTCVRAVHA
jgi:hypothetical protein